MRVKYYIALGALLTTLSFSCRASLPSTTPSAASANASQLANVGDSQTANTDSSSPTPLPSNTNPQFADNTEIPKNLDDILKYLKAKGVTVAQDPRGANEQEIFQKALAGTKEWEDIMKAEGKDYTQPVIMAWEPKRVSGSQVDGQLVVWDRNGNELGRFNFGRSSSGQTPDGAMLGICEEYNGQPGTGYKRDPTWMNMNANLNNSIGRSNTPCDIHGSSARYFGNDPLPRLTTAGCTAVQNYNEVRPVFYALNDYAKASGGAAAVIYNGNYNFQENLVSIPSITYRGIKYINGQATSARRR